MKKEPLKASKLTYILFGICAIIVISIIGGGAFAATSLQKQSVTATHAVIDASVSENNASRVLELQNYLQKNAGLVSETSSIAGSIGQYDQNTIIATINTYARTAGVTVTSFSFGGTGSGTAATPAATAATAGSIDIGLSTPLPYRNFITFVNLLEKGVMPVQIVSATIGADENPTNISATGIRIKVTN